LPVIGTSSEAGSKVGGAPLSFVDLRNQANEGGVHANTFDILFLKRLLFLKATLDNC
jgi:hypothetical protein